MNRRTFIQTSACATGAVLSHQLAQPLLAFPADSKYLDSIGLQLWTVRNQLAADPKATLKTIADAGYKQVELMDTSQLEKLQPICKQLGLNITSSFMNWQSICTPGAKGVPTVDAIVESASKAGLKHLVFGYIGKGHRETAAKMKSHAVAANAMGAKCKAKGIQLCYHNHSFEFAKLSDSKKNGFEVLMEQLDKDLVKFEVDVFWVKIGGWNEMETLEKLDGRVSQVHLKDLKKGVGVITDEGQVPVDAFQELGAGTIDMSKVLELAEQVGADNCHVEQDQSPAPLKSIGTSIDHLKTLASKK